MTPLPMRTQQQQPADLCPLLRQNPTAGGMRGILPETKLSLCLCPPIAHFHLVSLLSVDLVYGWNIAFFFFNYPHQKSQK